MDNFCMISKGRKPDKSFRVAQGAKKFFIELQQTLLKDYLNNNHDLLCFSEIIRIGGGQRKHPKEKENWGIKKNELSITHRFWSSFQRNYVAQRVKKYHSHQLGPSQLRQQATHRNRRLHSSSQRCRPHLRIF